MAPSSLLKEKPFITLGGDLLTLFAIVWRAVGIQQGDALLAGYIRPDKPGAARSARAGRKRMIRQLRGVIRPALLRLRSRRDARVALLANVADAIGNPLHNHLGASGEIAERRRSGD